MKILWVNNIIIPKIATHIGAEVLPIGGWMVKLADMLSLNNQIELIITFPYSTSINGQVDNIKYRSFNIDKDISAKNCKKNVSIIEQILKDVRPDVIHIFGTEFAHSYIYTEAAKKCGMQSNTVISIQGLKSIISKHYSAFLPFHIVFGFTARDLYKHNIYQGMKKFEKSGILERKAIKNVSNIIGRTDWDRACTFLFNPKARYFHNSEMLRDSFYTSRQWNITNCTRHSIFFSQASFPLKGLHIMVEALAIVKDYFPDVKLRIAGKDFTKKKKKIMYSLYETYLLEQIKKNRLCNIIEFTDLLNESQMVNEYQKCNVFVSASSIENSPNSLCEAMILGTPIVSSFVGGVPTLIEHGKDGYLYPADESYMLAYYIMKIFEDDEIASSFSNSSRLKAQNEHNVDKIMNELIDIYTTISNGSADR